MTTIVTERAPLQDESRFSAVSWGAIAGGAVLSAGFTLFLIELGIGLGLSSISPWTATSTTITRISVGAGVSLILIAVMASALGGYAAGRLRTRWSADTNENAARDTLHGLMAWAFATVILATALASAATTMVSSISQGASGNPALVPDRTSYYVDTLFRSTQPATQADQSGQTAEVGRILGRSLSASGISSNDKTYVAQLVARRTGIPQQEAEARVDAVIAQAKTAADEARKAARNLAFWMAAALLAGALAAGIGAREGGRERDAV